MNSKKNNWWSFFLLIFSVTHLSAQDYTFKNYDWDEKDVSINVPEQYKNENETILSRIVKIQLVSEKNSAVQYYLLHDRIYINADDAIERNNKVYISLDSDENLVSTKVRVILKNGKTIVLNQKDIKEEVDEEKGIRYHYFAVNGLEKGSVIEKITIKEQIPQINGCSHRLQDRYPIAHMDFQLIYPNHLVFKTKSLNGLSEPMMSHDTINNRITLQIKDQNIAALNDDEKYSNWNNQVRMFRYKLDENKYSGAKNMFNFKAFATNTFDRFNTELDKKESKAIADFCGSIPKSNDVQEQIWNIENKIKKNVVYNQYQNSNPGIIETLKIKQGNQIDMIKLYLAVFKYFNIENNMVYTSDRFNIPFQEDFESYENLSNVLFYFPVIKKYISPTNLEYRIPYFPSGLANNRGLFIKSRMFGGVAMGVGEINFIEIPGIEYTHDHMDITVDFTQDIENPSVTEQLSYGGYTAITMQPLKDFVPADQYKTILKSIAENYSTQKEFKTLKAGNDGIDYIGKKPFLLDFNFDGADLVKKAGPTYIFSVGLIIGKQNELYQESKRMMPVEINYPHSYTRKIHILLPPGLSVKNLEKLALDYKTVVNGTTQAAFTSKYSQTGNEILIENEEYYKSVSYPLEQFEQYRSVINAAADFNKIVLVFNK